MRVQANNPEVIRFVIHLVAPAVAGMILGWLMRWTLFQCLAMALSLIMLIHWLSIRFDWDAYEWLDRKWIASMMLAVLGLIIWLAFYCWERPGWVGGLSIGGPPEPGPMLDTETHPRIISISLAIVPAIPYLLETIIFRSGSQQKGAC